MLVPECFQEGSSLYLVLAPEMLTCPKEMYGEKRLGFAVKVYLGGQMGQSLEDGRLQ